MANQGAATYKKRWNDESESDSDVKDNWDDSEEEQSEEEQSEEEEEQKEPAATKGSSVNKEAARKIIRDEESEDEMELLSKKEQEKRQVIQADMQNAEELFSGMTIKDQEFQKAIQMKPRSLDEFKEYRKVLMDKIRMNCGESRYYGDFVNDFVRDLCEPLKDVEINKISRALTALANEKQKAAKASAKGKGKKGAASSAGVKKVNVGALPKGKLDITDYTDKYDDFDDFM